MEKRAVTYIRVSDKSQLDNNSFETQEKYCGQLATQLDAEVVDVYEEKAQKGSIVHTRPKLRELVEFVTNKKNCIDYVLVYKLDRYARNVEDGLLLMTHLAKYGVEVKSATEHFENDPTGKMIRTIILANAQWDNEMKGVRVKQNMQTQFRKGLWCWKPLPGYKRPFKSKEESKGLPPVKNSPLCEIVKNVFIQANTGIYSRNQLAEEANILDFAKYYGKPANHKIIVDILKNSFYYGLMHAPKWNEDVIGLHEPLISEELWHSVQHKMFGVKMKYNVQDNKLYPLKGSVKCAECGNPLTSSNPTSKTGRHYLYYSCTRKGCSVSVGINSAHDQFKAVLQALKPSTRTLKMFNELVFNEWDEQINSSKERASSLERQLTELNGELTSIRRALV
jgi:site-specific DNA recombinase